MENLTIIGVALLRAGLNEDRRVSVIFPPCRPYQLVFVHNQPVLEVSSGKHELVVISPAPAFGPRLRSVGGIAVRFLGASN